MKIFQTFLETKCSKVNKATIGFSEWQTMKHMIVFQMLVFAEPIRLTLFARMICQGISF